jgi:hypothetical protein
MSAALYRLALAVSGAVTFLAACGGSQPPMAARGMMPQTLAPQVRYKQNLLYVSTSPEAVFVYSYPGGKRLASLGYFESPGAECSDNFGNVFIATAQGTYEFAHDGANPIAVFSVRGSCSVDPVLENLAVCGGPVVSVFHHTDKHGWLLPRNYDLTFNSANCGYDKAGNLFADGLDKNSAFQLAVLSSKAKRFTPVTLNQSIRGPGQIQWDGSYLAIEDSDASPSMLYQFSTTGSTGQEVGSTLLSGATNVAQFWIHGREVVGSSPYDNEIAFWDYPAGGSPVNTATVSDPYGVTISVPHR